MLKENTVGKVGERIVKNKLKQIGFNVKSQIYKDYPHDFDFLVNNIKVEVKTSTLRKAYNRKYKIFNFCLIQNKGKFDILICLGFFEKERLFFIIPTYKIKSNKGISIIPYSDTENWKYYSKFIDKWKYLYTDSIEKK